MTQVSSSRKYQFGATVSLAAIAAVLALDAGAAKKLIFIGWDTGDLTPAEIVRNADALYEAGADGVGIYPRLQAKNGGRTGWLLARVPDDVNGLVLGLGAKQKKEERLLFADVQLMKLRDAPDGAKELLQTPKTKK